MNIQDMIKQKEAQLAQLQQQSWDKQQKDSDLANKKELWLFQQSNTKQSGGSTPPSSFPEQPFMNRFPLKNASDRINFSSRPEAFQSYIRDLNINLGEDMVPNITDMNQAFEKEFAELNSIPKDFDIAGSFRNETTPEDSPFNKANETIKKVVNGRRAATRLVMEAILSNDQSAIFTALKEAGEHIRPELADLVQLYLYQK